MYSNQPILQDSSSLLRPPPSPLSHLSDNSQTNLLEYSQASPCISKKHPQMQQQLAEDEDEDMLQRINNILQIEDGQHMTRKQILLSYKVNELQKLNKELILINHQIKTSAVGSQSTCKVPLPSSRESAQTTDHQSQLKELQKQITKYKTELQKFQATLTQKCTRKDQQIQFWKSKACEIQKKVQQQVREKNAIITLLQRKNKQLILALQSLQSPAQQMYPIPFNDHISSQLESMINKLLKELTYEKKCNKKLSAQVKRLNAEVLMLEREGKERNQKMYHLQMKALRGRKEIKRDQSPIRKQEDIRRELSSKKGVSPRQYQRYWQEEEQKQRYPRAAVILQARSAVQTNNAVQAKSATKHRFNSPPQYTPNRISPEKQSAKQLPFKIKSQPQSSFTLMDMLNGDVRVREQSKRAIASKVIQVYARKMGMGQYENVVAQQVEIYNFIPGNPSSLKVRLSSLLPKSQATLASPQSLLWNMAFILDALLNQVQSQGLGSAPQIDLNKWIEEIMRKQSNEEKERVMRRFALQVKGNIQSLMGRN